MKKFLTLVIDCFFIVCLCACSSGEITGLDHFTPADCSDGLARYLFPDENFLSTFQYNNGDYKYKYEDDWDGGYATAFAYLSYSPNVYEEAKAYCLDNFEFCDVHQYTHNGFEFSEHLCYRIRDTDDNLVVGCCYPEKFNLFAYNDQSYTLIFLGYYNPNNVETELAEADFGSFLEEIYFEYLGFTE